MRVLINSQTIEGKPEDIANLLAILNPAVKRKTIQVQTKEQVTPAHSLQDTVKQSEELRKKLAENPNYNPFGGVVRSPEPGFPEQQLNRDFHAEEDTGIKYE